MADPCNCVRRQGNFKNVTFVVDDEGKPYALIAGVAVVASKVSILDGDPGEFARLVIEVPMPIVDVISWSELKARRESDALSPSRPDAPAFDAPSPEQERLAIEISSQICNGARPDPVQVLEWAGALYRAEMGEVR